jgi:hypothetical protein
MACCDLQQPMVSVGGSMEEGGACSNELQTGHDSHEYGVAAHEQ